MSNENKNHSQVEEEARRHSHQQRGWQVLLVLWTALLGLGIVLISVCLVRAAMAGQGLSPKPSQRHQVGLTRRGTGSPTADTSPFRLVTTIPLTPGIGQEPVDIASDWHSPLVYIANRGSHDITVVSGTRPLGMVAAVHEGTSSDYSIQVGVHPTNGLLYAVEEGPDRNSLYTKNMVLQIISTTQAITVARIGSCDVERGSCGTTALAFQPLTGLAYLLSWYRPSYVLPLEGYVTIWSEGQPLARIPLGEVLPRYLGVDPAAGYVYVSADSADAVTVLSGTDRLATVPVLEPGRIAVQPRTGLVYVESRDDDLAVLTGTGVLTTIPIGAVADLVADPAHEYLYVSHPDIPAVTVVSGTGVLTQVAVIEPGGTLEYDQAHGLVYLRHSNASLVTVLSGTHVLTEAVVPGSGGAIEANPATGLVYAVDGAGSVAVLHEGNVLADLQPAAPQPRIMERNPLTGQIIVIGEPPSLSILEENELVAAVPLASAPEKMVIHPISGLIYLTLPDQNAVMVMDGVTPLSTIPLKDTPKEIAVQPASGLVYVLEHSGTLHIIKGTEELAAMPLCSEWNNRIAADSTGGLVYVTDTWGNALHVLSGTQVITDIHLAGVYNVAVVPGSRAGLTYAAGGGTLWALSGTAILTQTQLNEWVIDMVPSPSSAGLYLHLRTGGPQFQWDQVGTVTGLGSVVKWPFQSPGNTLFSSLAADPSRNYLFAGQAAYGSYLSIGVGPAPIGTMKIGDGSWIRAIVVEPEGGRAFIATDHAIAVIQEYLPYRFCLPFLPVSARPATGGTIPGAIGGEIPAPVSGEK